MVLSKRLRAVIDKARLTDSYWIERVKQGFAISLESRRRSRNLTNAEIAKAVGVSPAYISKVFRGDTNFTIETMVKLARSTGGNIRIEIEDALAPSLATPVHKPLDASYKLRSTHTNDAQSIIVEGGLGSANGYSWGNQERYAA